MSAPKGTDGSAAARNWRALTGPVSGVSFVVGVVAAARLAPHRIPRTGAPAEEVRAYYRDSSTAVRVSVTGQIVSIVAQGMFTGVVARLAARSPGSRLLRAVAIVSGAAAASALSASASTHAALARSQPEDDAGLTAKASRVFVLGGPVHGVAYGVFIAALTVAARRAGLIGRAAAVTGAVSAVAGVASPLYFRWEAAGWLIPIGRFTGYLLAGLTGARLFRNGGRDD